MLLDRNGNPLPDVPEYPEEDDPEPMVSVRINNQQVLLPRNVAEILVNRNDEAREEFYERAGREWLLTVEDLDEMRRKNDPLKALAYAGEVMFKRWRRATIENAKLRRMLRDAGLPWNR